MNGPATASKPSPQQPPLSAKRMAEIGERFRRAFFDPAQADVLRVDPLFGLKDVLSPAELLRARGPVMAGTGDPSHDALMRRCLLVPAPRTEAQAAAWGTCRHLHHVPAFNEDEALALESPAAVRRRFPHFEGHCSRCGKNVRIYASPAHLALSRDVQ